MATEFNFKLDDSPGELARIAKVLADAGINIDGGAGVRMGGRGMITVVTHEPDIASKTLSNAGISFESEEVLIITLKDRPGALADLTKAFAEENINLTSFYITMAGEQVIGADNIEKARSIAEKKGLLVR